MNGEQYYAELRQHVFVAEKIMMTRRHFDERTAEYKLTYFLIYVYLPLNVYMCTNHSASLPRHSTTNPICIL